MIHLTTSARRLTLALAALLVGSLATAGGGETHHGLIAHLIGGTALAQGFGGEPGRDGSGREGSGRDGSGRDGSGREGSGREGSGRDGSGREGSGRDGSGREGSGREGSGREGSGREGSGREGSGRDGPEPGGAGEEGPGEGSPGGEGPGTQSPGLESPASNGPDHGRADTLGSVGGADGGRLHLDRLVPVPEEFRRGRTVDAPQAAPPRPARGAARRAPPPRRTRRAPPPAQPPAPAPPPLPSEREGEIVAAGIEDAALDTLSGQGFAVIEETPIALLGADIVRLSVPAGLDTGAAVAAVLAAAPGALVDGNTLYTPTQGADCEGLACFQLAMIGWPQEARTPPAPCGSGITIGIVDTGINPQHEALAAADVTLLPLLGGDPQTSRRSHGTAVAAVLVGSGDPRIQGLLPAARIVAVDAFEEDPEGRTFSDAFRLVAAIDRVASETPDVMNLSLTGPANAILEAAIEAVTDGGILVVAAVGNAGPSAPPLYPAAYPRVLAATAVDENLVIYRRAVRGEHVDFAAPGVQVWTAASRRGARPKTGTSFAAPFVTAAAALARQSGAADHDAVMEMLSARVADLGESGRDRVYGFGLINAADLCAAPAAATPPVTAASDEPDAGEGVFTPAGE